MTCSQPIADGINGKVFEVKDKKSGEQYITEVLTAAQSNPEYSEKIKLIERLTPEIWVASMTASEILDDDKAWFADMWRGYHLIPYYAHHSTAPIKNKEYLVQGIPRGMRDINFAYNKLIVQELHHLNSSANSGWIAEEGSWVNEDKVKEFGSSAGVNLFYKKETTPGREPQKIKPTPLSTGHEKLAEHLKDDIKLQSGINTDLLAMNERQASGRAIMMRQKQGMVMVQKFFDNLSQTKRILGRFILSQLGKVYDVDSAIKVCGEQFINVNFSEPVMAPNPSMGGQPAPKMNPATGKLQMEVNQKLLFAIFNKILKEPLLGKYDISIGESTSSETIKYANYLTIMDMVQKGLPIPPEVILDESTLSKETKDKITKAIESTRMAQAAPAPA